MKLTLLLICLSFCAAAQKNLGLSEAWQLAEQNPQLLQKAQEANASKVDAELATRLRLPTVNAQYQSPLNLGRSIDPYTNSFDTRTILGNNYGVTATYMLFDNGQIKNQIAAAQNYHKALGMETKVAVNTLKNQVLLTFSEVLLGQQQIETLHTQLKTTQENLTYLNKLYAADRIRYAVVLSMENEVARLLAEKDQLQGDLEVAKTKLWQITGSGAAPLPYTQEPEHYKHTLEALYFEALRQLPELKAMGFYRQQKRNEENLLYAQRLPTVSLFSNVGTTYSSAAMEVKNNELQKMGYFTQFGNNLNMNVGLNVQVPVFNSVNYKQKLQKNTVEQKIMQHQENNRKLEIKQTIEEAYHRLNASVNQYKTLKERTLNLEKLSHINKRGFEEGRSEFNEFLQSRRDLELAQSQLNRLKYQYLVYFKQLEFYRTGIWE